MSAPTAGPRLVARIVPDDLGSGAVPVPSRGQRLARRASLLFAGLMVVFAASMGATGGAVPAQAGPLDGIKDAMKDLMCFGEQEKAPAPNSSNAESAVSGNRSPFEGSLKNKSVTAYEEFGTTGLFWSQYRPTDGNDNADGRAGCLTNKMDVFIGNFVANSTFQFTNAFTMVTTTMYLWAADGDLLSSFTDPLDCVVDGCNGGKGLKTTLFLNYLMPIVMFGALWGAYNGLVKKRTTETAQGGLWMVGATTFAIVFMANPGWVAEKSNDVVNEVSTTIMNSVTSATSANIGKDDMCWITPSSKQRGNRMAACSMYKAMLVTPWASGQFGVPLSTKLESDEAGRIGDREFKDMRVAQIEAQTVSQTELNSGDDFKDIKEADAEIWDSIRADVMAGDSGASPMMWTGDQPSQRVNIAFASLIATMCLGLLVVVISFSTVVMAVGMILLIMMAPLFLLIGIHPGFGRGIALKWLELLLGTVFKRIVLSAMLAILVGMYQVILEQDMPWLAQVALITALGIGALTFRKPMLETLNVINLGGSRTGMEAGMGQAGRKAGGAATGAAAGGLAGVRAGGGLGGAVGGAVKGGTMGSRSGSPVRAATMGSSAGRRVGSQKKIVRDAKKTAEELAAERDQHLAAGEDVPKKLADRIEKHNQRWGNKAPVPRPARGMARGVGGGDQRPISNECESCQHPRHGGMSCRAVAAKSSDGKGMLCNCKGPSGPNDGGGGGGGGGGAGSNPRPQPRPTTPTTPTTPVAGGGVPTAPPVATGKAPVHNTGGGVPTRPPVASPGSGTAPTIASPAEDTGGPADSTPGAASPPPRPQGR